MIAWVELSSGSDRYSKPSDLALTFEREIPPSILGPNPSGGKCAAGLVAGFDCARLVNFDRSVPEDTSEFVFEDLWPLVARILELNLSKSGR